MQLVGFQFIFIGYKCYMPNELMWKFYETSACACLCIFVCGLSYKNIVWRIISVKLQKWKPNERKKGNTNWMPMIFLSKQHFFISICFKFFFQNFQIGCNISTIRIKLTFISIHSSLNSKNTQQKNDDLSKLTNCVSGKKNLNWNRNIVSQFSLWIVFIWAA